MAGARHGMCELTHGMTGEWHAMHEPTLSFTDLVLKSPEISCYCAA